jgi:hypothetical protein
VTRLPGSRSSSRIVPRRSLSLDPTMRWCLVLPAVALLASCQGGTAAPDVSGGPPPKFALGGPVSGLQGSGLVLLLDGTRELPIPAGATSYTFGADFATGAQYQLAVKVQPTGPSQTCALAGARGAVGTADVSVALSCVTSSFAVGGVVLGLTGAGLTLQLNSGPSLSISPGTAGFSFPPLQSGSTYAVAITGQPASQACTLSSGTGTLTDHAVGTVLVACQPLTYTVGGAIVGLTGAGLSLQVNGKGDLAIPAGATQFTFADAFLPGTAYGVTAKTWPAGQACSAANASGTVGSAQVTSVVVSCVDTSATVAGTITGLSGSGLALQLNGGPPLAVPAGATAFTFPALLAPSSAYAVTIAAHPSGQACSVAGGAGTVGGVGSTTRVTVSCSDSAPGGFTVGGTVTGLTDPGLVLNANGFVLSVPAGATRFTFPALAPGTAYGVFAAATPANQWCTITGGSGTMASADVTGVAVACTPRGYKVKGTVTGLVGTGLDLLFNGGGRLALSPGATTFSSYFNIPTGATYTVTIGFQPSNPTQACTIANATGVMGTADQADVRVDCVTVWRVRATVGPDLLRSNGGTLLFNGGQEQELKVCLTDFTFPSLPTGTPYSVTLGRLPAAPPHVCTVTNGSGIVGSADVTNIQVDCVAQPFALGGILTGYRGSGLTLVMEALRGGVPLPSRPPLAPQCLVRYAFPDLYTLGDLYRVSIGSQPAGQTCTLRNALGQLPQPALDPFVRTAIVDCVDNVPGALSGVFTALQGTRRHDLALWPDGTFTAAFRADDVACANQGNGVEYGAFRYDATAGTLTLLTVTTNTTVVCGLTTPGVVPAIFPASVAGDALTLTVPTGALTFTRVASVPGSLTGPWVRAAGQDGSFVVFRPDGTYLDAEPQGAGSNGLAVRPGVERGCYAATSTAITADLSAACKPDGNGVVDTNGESGFSAVRGPLPFTITGPDALTLGDTALVRFH